MLIHKLLNKDPDIVPEESLLIILDIKSAACMVNNGKDTKHSSHIDRRVHSVRNGERFKMHNFDWCEQGMQLIEIATKNVSENELYPRMKYTMLSLDK